MVNISRLYERTNYLLDIPYITSYVTEYDLSKANISSLKYMGYLSDKDYNWLYNADKMVREIYIGNLERSNHEVSKLKKQGILEARKQLFFENKLQDSEILSIKNDAVFVIGNRLIKNQFEHFTFNKKNVYTFFMSTSSKLEIYYLSDRISNLEVIDVKGINDNILPLHENYMISFLCEIFYMIQNNTIEDTISYFNDFYKNFIELKLDIGYYREFNAESIYRINSERQSFGFQFIDPSYLRRNSQGNSIINIDCNVLLLRDIYAILSDMYFRTKR